MSVDLDFAGFDTLGLGAANLGNLYRAMSDEVATQIVSDAWSQGVRYFDTAPHYGLGLSETRLGSALSRYPREAFTISTKVGRLIRPNPQAQGGKDTAGFDVPDTSHRVWDCSETGVQRSLEESLRRLSLDHVDIALLHDPEEYDLNDGLQNGLPALARLKEQGVVKAIGVGSKSVTALLQAVQTGLCDVIMLAGRLTLLEQTPVSDLLPACREHGVGIIDVGVYNSGVLAKHVPTGDMHYEYGDVPAQVLERLDALRAICDEFSVTIPQAAIQFPRLYPEVVNVVIGASSPRQVETSFANARVEIPAAFWQKLSDRGLVRWSPT